MPRLFAFGMGYSATRWAARLQDRGWSVAGTRREAGDGAFPFDRTCPLGNDGREALRAATHILSSVPPDADGDPVLDLHGDDIAACTDLEWVGYLSTTGVYGDTGGAMADESTPRWPTAARSVRRAAAEDAWLELWRTRGVPVHLFRLAGIYGPGRSELDRVRAGTAKRIDRPGHRFCRIHVDDIGHVLDASVARPDPGTAYNVADDRPAEPREVTECACRLLGVTPPQLVPFDEAEKAMSPMMRSFWRDRRSISNSRLHRDLGVDLAFPDFEAGLAAVLAEEGTGG